MANGKAAISQYFSMTILHEIEGKTDDDFPD